MRLSFAALTVLFSESDALLRAPPTRAAVQMNLAVGDVVPLATRETLGVQTGRAVIFSVRSDTDRRCARG